MDSNIVSNNLSLDPPTQKEVCEAGYHTYRQYLHYDNQKVLIQAPTFQQNGLSFRTYKDIRSILVPIDPWLRNQFHVLEKFIIENVVIPEDVCKAVPNPPKYKPLWDGDYMCLAISQWCKYYRETSVQGTYESVDSNSQFGDGMYQLTIEAPYIYIGPHKDGASFSLTLRVVQIVFKPNLLMLTPTIVCDCASLSPSIQSVSDIASTEQKQPAVKKAKRSRKKKEEKKEEENVSQMVPDLANFIADCAL